MPSYKRCIEPECKKLARGATDKCVAHGGGRRCAEPECGKSAQGATDKCIEHGGGRRCPNCIDWVDSRVGCEKYDWYCATCFKRVFPNDPRSAVIYGKSKEIKVRNKINDNFPDFIHDKPLITGNCKCVHRRRVDHRKLIGNTILAIETDEFAHRSYDPHDEEIRYNDLVMIDTCKWIFIRFNPDDNRESQKTSFESKLEALMAEMKRQIERIDKEENEELVEIVKMFL